MPSDLTVTMIAVALGKRVQARLGAQIDAAFVAAGVSRKVLRPTALIDVHWNYRLDSRTYCLTIESRLALGGRPSKVCAYRRLFVLETEMVSVPMMKFLEHDATASLGATLGEQLTQVLNEQSNAYDQLPLPWRASANADTHT